MKAVYKDYRKHTIEAVQKFLLAQLDKRLMTQAELVSKMKAHGYDISLSSIGNYTRGQRVITSDRLLMLADFF